MTELLTAAQMRAIEQAAIASGEVTGLELMERAGRGVVEAILEWRPELATTAHRAVVLCGPGNNGGDGFVVARLLKQRGWEVEVFLYGDEAKLPPDAGENCRRWREMGEMGEISQLSSSSSKEQIAAEYERMCSADVIVDGLFGTGLKRGMEPLWCAISVSHDQIIDGPYRDDELCRPFIISLDVPSGLCADSGAELAVEGSQIDTVIRSHITVTFHRAKVGHFLGEGPSCCRRIRIVDIGLLQPVDENEHDPIRPDPSIVRLISSPSEDWFLIDELRREPERSANKYSHGHALVLAGGVGHGGAARLAARGALRVGAGLVTVGPPPAAVIENAAQLNTIMLRPVADADALAEILTDERINALCLGPGLGVGARTLELVAAGLAAKRNTVLDADALTSFAEDPSKLFALAHERCILTPHMGEFARLFPDIAAKLSAPATKGPAYSKVDAAREAAARAGCVVLLKGPDTVMADPEGRAAINSAHYERAAPWLATAGSGDVLAGMITGLMARGLRPMAAAETAAWLHVEAARKFGPGLIAEDLPEMIPAVFRDLGL